MRVHQGATTIQGLPLFPPSRNLAANLVRLQTSFRSEDRDLRFKVLQKAAMNRFKLTDRPIDPLVRFSPLSGIER